MRAGTRVNIEQGPRNDECGSRSIVIVEKADGIAGSERHGHRNASAGVMMLARMEDETGSNTGSPGSGVHPSTGNPRGLDWAVRVAERLVVPKMRG